MRRIAVVTGSRAEYGLLRPVIAVIEEHPRLALQLVVAGMHLDPRHGHTVDAVVADGWTVAARVEMTPADDTPGEMARSVGRGVLGFESVFGEIAPDLALVLGDRTEALAAVLAAAYRNIPCGHIHGGDLSRAGLDESARHAITKFAHVHFPATERSAERIRRLGEEESRIHVVGAPGLDSALAAAGDVDVESALGLRLAAPPLVLVQHPVSTEPEEARSQMEETLAALTDLGRDIVAIYPNSDAGGRRMIAALEEHAARDDRFHLFPSLDHDVYLALLRQAALLVGNSSSGIIEAASFELPVVDIGRRQEGRERARNVISAPTERAAIRAAVERALTPEFREALRGLINPYGDGRAASRIVQVLAEMALEPTLLQKQMDG